MNNIIRLIKNENLKNISQNKTILILIIVLVSIIGSAFMSYSSGVNNTNWRDEKTKEIQRMEKAIEENNATIAKVNDEEAKVYRITVASYEKRVDLLKYSLEKNIPMDVNTPWKFVYEVNPTVNILILFLIVLSIHSITKEYTYGTVKQIFIRPYKRWKILLTKYISIVIISFISIVIHFAISLIMGYLFFYKNGNGTIEIIMSNDSIVERNVVSYVVQNYMFVFIKILVLSSLAVMLAVLIKKSALPIIITLLVWFGSGAISLFIKKYWIAKVSLFPHLNLSQYMPGESVMIEGSTLMASIVILTLYFVAFNIIAYVSMSKQDIY